LEHRRGETLVNFSARTLVIAAHPDDEVLGCGATMARISSENGVVQSMFLTNGESSRFPSLHHASGEQDEKIARRMESAQSAALILGSLPPKFYSFPDNSLDSVPLLEIAKTIEEVIQEFRPSRIFTHYSGDLNIDHQKVHEATLVACRPQSGNVVEEIICFEIPSSTEWRSPTLGLNFSPNFFVSAKGFESKKFEALTAYGSEMREFPHPRSKEAISALMTWRGSTSNLHSAEAFVLARGIYQ
jgi:LmbE family N-acetylglucosaminyl deacetylase